MDKHQLTHSNPVGKEFTKEEAAKFYLRVITVIICSYYHYNMYIQLLNKHWQTSYFVKQLMVRNNYSSQVFTRTNFVGGFL